MQLSRPTWTRRRIATPVDLEEELAEVESPLPVALRAGPEPLIVEEGCAFEGRLQTNRPVLIRGDFSGTVECGATVVVAAGGSVQGDIRARSVFIEGAVVGDVVAVREVELQSTARLHGNITTASLVLERGAYFIGQTQMLRPQDASRRAVAI